MSFDLSKAIATAKRDQENTHISAILFGPSGAGKSRATGTLPGPILFLYSEGEAHGSASANSAGGKVLPVRYDEDDVGQKLAPDAAYARLLNVLGSADMLKGAGIQSVVIDGLTELETVIRSTAAFKNGCKNKNGAHDAFQESKVVLEMLRPVLDALRNLQKSIGVHYVVTCALEVTEIGDDGEILAGKPKLSTYSVVETLTFNFPDQLIVGPMTKNGKKARRFQFDAELSRVSKEGTKIKKILNMSPRLIPAVEELPDNIAADFTKLAEAKEAGKWITK